MAISKKKQTELYAALYDEVMTVRVAVKQSEDTLGNKNASDIDDKLSRLERNIWSRAKRVLGI